MDWYSKDFGKTKDDILAWIRKSVPSLSNALQNKKGSDVKFQKFHWDFYYKFVGAQEKEEDRLSLIKDPRRRAQLLEEVADIKVKTDFIHNQKPKLILRGPDIPDGNPENHPFIDNVAAKSISTYPIRDKKTGKREGDPICDQFHVQYYENGASIVALADGCNWGEKPRDAARISVDTFVNYMKDICGESKSLHPICIHIMRAFMLSHQEIIGNAKDEETLFECGTTTLLGGLLLPIQDRPSSWVFLCACLGDCKAYHYSSKKNIISDLTAGNRLNVSNARDPGGRLGPYVDDGGPDLRNFRFYSKVCEEDDLLFLMTDGVVDNLGYFFFFAKKNLILTFFFIKRCCFFGKKTF